MAIDLMPGGAAGCAWAWAIGKYHKRAFRVRRVLWTWQHARAECGPHEVIRRGRIRFHLDRDQARGVRGVSFWLDTIEPKALPPPFVG